MVIYVFKQLIYRECYEKHIENNFCNQSKKCNACGVIWDVEVNTRNGRKGHNCLERYCKVCDCFHSKERLCYIQPFKPHKELPIYRFLKLLFPNELFLLLDALHLTLKPCKIG